MRVDGPDVRSIESAVSNDFDLLAGEVMSSQRPLIVAGFTIDTTSVFGAPAGALVLRTAGGVVMHWNATEAGTMLRVAADQADEALNSSNARVSGSFASNTTNYVGIDYLRSADETTSDVTKFLPANATQEVARSVPKARTLDYRVIISTSPFSLTTNVCPVAKVTTDASGNVVSVTDARNMLGRLAPGGDVPNPLAGHVWEDAGRRENANTYAPPSSTDNPFSGGDKEISSLKSWMDAIMTVLWEAKSGTSWYSPTTRDGIKLCCTTSVIAATGDNFDWTASPTLKWKGLRISFENSAAYYNVVQDNEVTGVTINDGQCLYVDIDRSQVATVVAQVGTLTALPAPTIPGSRVIIAWRVGTDMFIRDRGFDITRTIPVATTAVTGIVRLNVTPGAPSAPVVIAIQANGTASVTATGGNAVGFTATGNGTGAGLVGNGGITGAGVVGNGGVGGNTSGVFGQGNGTGGGVVGVGGATAGAGVSGTGGGGNASGVSGLGTGTGSGINGAGGATSGAGVAGTGGGPNGNGVFGQGTGTGNGIRAIGGATGSGVRGEGGATSGAGVTGVGTAGNAAGVVGQGQGSGAGVNGTGGATSGAVGVQGTGGSTNGVGVRGDGVGTGAGGVFDGPGTGTASADDAIISNQNIRLAGSNPAGTTGFVNRITPLNVCKAWALIRCVAGTPSILASFNIDTADYDTGALLVDFAVGGGMSSGNYVCMVNGSGWPRVFNTFRNGSGFTIQAESASGVGLNLDGSDQYVQIIVFGAQ